VTDRTWPDCVIRERPSSTQFRHSVILVEWSLSNEKQTYKLTKMAVQIVGFLF